MLANRALVWALPASTPRARARLNASTAHPRQGRISDGASLGRCANGQSGRGPVVGDQDHRQLPVLPDPRDRRLSRTLTRWRAAFLAYLDTGGSSNRGTEAINGLIELHRRIARDFGTATTTDYACYSSAEDFTYRKYEEPVNRG